MTEYPALLRSVIAGEHLSSEMAALTIGAIMDETISPTRAAAFLAALAAKGETVEEVVGAARAMRDRSVRVEHGLPYVLDVCGTGGDGAGTINISTAVSFVVAGAGVPVAKHGNRAASSQCGSADVLEKLGVTLDRSPEESATMLRDHKIAFLFAQRHHPAMRVVAPIRRELGVRTIFNLLGPLTNPAGASRQVVGVAQERFVPLVAEALRGLGGDSGAVVYGASGLDEIAGDSPTTIYQFDRFGTRQWTLDPARYGVHASMEVIRGGDASFNASALLAIVRGERTPRARLVVLNAAFALVIAGVASDIEDGMHLAQHSIDTGAAAASLDELRGKPQMQPA